MVMSYLGNRRIKCKALKNVCLRGSGNWMITDILASAVYWRNNKSLGCIMGTFYYMLPIR